MGLAGDDGRDSWVNGTPQGPEGGSLVSPSLPTLSADTTTTHHTHHRQSMPARLRKRAASASSTDELQLPARVRKRAASASTAPQLLRSVNQAASRAPLRNTN